MTSPLDLTLAMRTFLDDGLSISPWLTGRTAHVRLDAAVFDRLTRLCEELYNARFTEAVKIDAFGTLPISDRLPRTALYEIAASTAMYLSLERGERRGVDRFTVVDALEAVEDFIDEHGMATLLRLYGLVTSYENYHALAWYTRIPETVYISGAWHRPWIDYTVSDELMLGVMAGNCTLVADAGTRCVTLTDRGREALKETEQILYASGYLDHRLRMLHVAQFNLYDDYDQLAQEIWPTALRLRAQFLDWSDIRPGMRVVEVGSANGPFTFDAGLVDRIGRSGFVACIDASTLMVRLGESRRQALRCDHVTFVHARAEEIPYPDDWFDGATAMASLHFTDLEQALREIHRVLRPGGVFTSAHPIKFLAGQSPYEQPWFAEWFSELLHLARTSKRPPAEFSLPREAAVDMARQVGFREIESVEIGLITIMHDANKSIRHFIHGIGWFQEELAQVPWKARNELIADLTQRGNELAEKNGAAEREFMFPIQWLRLVK